MLRYVQYNDGVTAGLKGCVTLMDEGVVEWLLRDWYR